jgi:hypothetical protein
MFRTQTYIVIVAALLAATPIAPAWAKADKSYATLHASEPTLDPANGRIYLYREGGIMGAAVQPAIRVNGEKVGDSSPGDYFYIDRPAGTYSISTKTEKSEELSVPLAAGQSVYVKFEVSMGFFVGHVLPSVVDAGKAADEIKDCDYDGAPPVVAAAAPTPAADAAPGSATEGTAAPAP